MTDNEKITKAQEYDKICALDENGNIPTDAMVQLALRLDKMKEQMKEIKEEVNKAPKKAKSCPRRLLIFLRKRKRTKRCKLPQISDNQRL